MLNFHTEKAHKTSQKKNEQKAFGWLATTGDILNSGPVFNILRICHEFKNVQQFLKQSKRCVQNK